MDFNASQIPCGKRRWTGFRPLAAAAALLLAGCAVGPSYHRPAIAVPQAYKEAAGWKSAAPNDAAQRGAWWEAFQDPVLNDFEAQIPVSNQSLKQAQANYEAARQILSADRSSFFPAISAAGSVNRSETAPLHPSNIYGASLQGSWEPDFWGRIRRITEADAASAQASAANLASAQLSLEASLAEDYIALRSLDERKRLLDNAVEAYRHTLKISQNKFDVGVAARSDVLSAQAQLDATRAQAIDVGVQRAQFEHAIAVLVGKAPADLAIAPRSDWGLAIPAIPSQMPSDLLERRPDVAAAERGAAEANARVGVQTAAYFPDITLSGSGGYQGSPLGKLFTAPFRFWTIGANASETLLDFGQRRAEVAEARAAYDASAAGYRQAVLIAFQQVEDDLAAVRILDAEAQVTEAAVSEAAEAARITMNEYSAGTVDFTTVLSAQVAEISDRETALAILESRLNSEVALIQALGGGWSSADLPSFGHR